MNALSAFITLLTIFAAGFGVSSLFLKREAPVSLAEVVPLSWLLGTAFVSLSLACLGIVFSGFVLQAIVTAGCIWLGSLGLKAWRKKQWPISIPKPAGMLEWALCLILLAEFIAVLWFQCRASLGWDGLLVWEIKARYAFLHGGVVPKPYFSDDTRAWSHPEYPLFLPLVETWLYLWVGDCDQSWVRVIFPVFYAAAMLLLCTGAYQLTGKRWAGLAAAAALFFLPGQWNSLGGFVDFPLAVFYLAAVIYLPRYFREGEPCGHLALFSILAGVLPWMKREGIILWFCLMAIAVPVFLWKREFRKALVIPLPGVAVAVGWNVAMVLLKTPRGTDFLPFTFGTVYGNLNRMGPILTALAHDLMETGVWSLLWYAFVVALAWLLYKSRRQPVVLLFLSVALPLGIDSCVYLLSSWSSYEDHMRTSLPRLILGVSLPALLTVVLAAADET